MFIVYNWFSGVLLEVIFMSNIINDIKEFNDVQSGVSRKHHYFNLEKFMNGGYNVDAAVCLITPLQVVMTDCYKKNDYMSYYTHEDTMKEIYGAVYCGNEEVLNKKWEMSWPYDVIKDGNICMQMCNNISKECSNDVAISIPNVISKEQYDALVDFNLYIKKIYENNKNYFDKRSICFRFSINNNIKESDMQSFNNIDSLLENIKMRIGDVTYRDEFIVGTSLNGSLSDNKRKGK